LDETHHHHDDQKGACPYLRRISEII
jgi:hypothetical protein